MPPDFSSLYNEAKKKHPELKDLSNDLRDCWSEEEKAFLQRRRTKNILIISALLPLSYFTIAVCAATTWTLGNLAAQSLSKFNYPSLLRSIPGAQIGSAVAVFAAIVYFLLGPLIELIGNKIKLPGATEIFRIYEHVNRKRASFVFVAAIALWLALGWGIATVASFGLLESHSLALAALIWLIPLMFSISIAPFAFVIIFQLLVRWREQTHATSEIEILRTLLRILADWPSNDATAAKGFEFRSKTAARIAESASRMRRLYFGKNLSNKSQEWASRQFALAADNLLVASSWLYLPRVQSAEDVRSRIIAFCNAFLTTQLFELPRKRVGKSDGLVPMKQKRRPIRTASFTLGILTYCMLPLLAFSLFKSQIASHLVPDSVWLLAYSLWIAIGLYAYLYHTTQNPVSMLLDVFKAAVRR
jgi:hypothetical protein